MKRYFDITIEAEKHLAQHYANIALDKIAPAERFLLIAHQSFERLAEVPLMGLPVPRIKNAPHLIGMRSYPLPAPYKSYVVFYDIKPDCIRIIAILHGMRDLPNVLTDLNIDV